MHSYWISNCSGLVTLDGLSSTFTLVTLIAVMAPPLPPLLLPGACGGWAGGSTPGGVGAGGGGVALRRQLGLAGRLLAPLALRP